MEVFVLRVSDFFIDCFKIQTKKRSQKKVQRSQEVKSLKETALVLYLLCVVIFHCIGPSAIHLQ